tara:strand:- start:866 stop:2482 length:1617 start_codon:yes stop_codon:yes gene_type:complete
MIAAFAFSAAKLDRNVAVEAVLERPSVSAPIDLPLSSAITLDADQGDALAIAVTNYGSDHVSLLHVRTDNTPVDITTGDGGHRTNRTTCVDNCVVVLRQSGDEKGQARITSTEGIATLHAVTFEPVTAKRHGSASGLQILAGFSLLLLLGPVLVWLRRWPGAEQIALAVGGMVWIGVAGLSGLAVAVVFVVAGYFAITAVGAIKERRPRSLAAALVGVALLVMLLKFAAPVMASAFANPGGLWLALPLGISYLAIRLIDLILAAHARALRGLTMRDYLAFMLSPYTLPAGPIQLYGDFLRGRIINWSGVDFAAGAARMGVGMLKKLLADSLLLPLVTNHMGNYLTGNEGAERSVLIMLVANLLYIYLDFSAYCDLAIGAARAGGRRLPENFNWPLVRSGLRRYWRHWHMTLSQWVMRRVYFPAFLASHSTTLALTASMLAIGLWHAPTISWTFWALHHSLAMAAEGKLNPAPPASALPPTGMAAQAWAGVRHLLGMSFMIVWVALGHSFTLFAAPLVALKTYASALTAPFVILWRLIT